MSTCTSGDFRLYSARTEASTQISVFKSGVVLQNQSFTYEPSVFAMPLKADMQTSIFEDQGIAIKKSDDFAQFEDYLSNFDHECGQILLLWITPQVDTTNSELSSLIPETTSQYAGIFRKTSQGYSRVHQSTSEKEVDFTFFVPCQGCDETNAEPKPPRPPPPPSPSPSSPVNYDATRVDAILQSMTLSQKIGQMLMIEIWLENDEIKERMDTSVVSETITRYSLGGVLGGGNAFWPMGPRTLATKAREVQSAAQQSSAKIPILFGIDAVHGNALIRGSTIFPHNIGLGAAENDTSLMHRMGRAVGKELRASGIHMAFGPCVALAKDMRWGRAYEGFSSDPKRVTPLAKAYMQGLQSGPHRIMGCPKHIAADGGTTYGTGKMNTPLDQGDARDISHKDLDEHLSPYREMVKAGAAVIMASYSSINGTPAHANKWLLTDWLKGEQNFSGFVLSDWNAIGDVCPHCWNTLENENRHVPDWADDYSREQRCEFVPPFCFPKSRVTAVINAGVDMIMMPTRFDEHFFAIKEAVEDGSISMQRINDAVRRILTTKFEFNLDFESEASIAYPDEPLLRDVGNREHTQLAKEAASKSTVLLMNEGVLPFKKGYDILWACSGGENKSRQLGGWSILWQGAHDSAFVQSMTDPFDFPEVKTRSMYESLREDFWCRGCIFRDANGSRYPSTSVAVAVVSEPPYAEWHGDKSGLYSHSVEMSREDKACLRNLHASNPSRPIVILVLSGRPIDVTPYFSNISGKVRGEKGVKAILSAWLPGGEGEGVADVLWGRRECNGTLPVSYGAGFLVGHGIRTTRTWKGCGCQRGPGGILWIVWISLISFMGFTIFACLCHFCWNLSAIVSLSIE